MWANFRYIIYQQAGALFKHMQVRVHAEALAFKAAAPVEEHRCNRRLSALVSTQMSLFNRRFMLTVVVNLFDYLGGILNYLVISIPIFAGLYDDRTPQQLSALISQNSFVCMYLIFNFTQLVDLASSATDVVGCTHRVGQLVERLAVLEQRWKSSPHTPDEDTSGGAPPAADDPQYDTPYALSKVSVCVPGARRTLVTALSLTVRRHRSLLVTGSSSCGKTSVLRVLRGLWPPATGRLQRHLRPGPGHVFFMPQRPFLTDGSLRQQIVYPERLKEGGYTVSETERMLHYLELVQLSSLADRCGGLDSEVNKNWYDMLSPGEMQRLFFVRLFHHRPVFVFMDEATSAVSPDMEEILYQECLRLKMTLFSVGHRESLTAYHDWKLHLFNDGTWRLDPIEHAAGGICP
ncbi:LOW QUALITY PROTEIN: lysosomal cobalamin transporter ABCD4-like [Pollicipes pollicipes]|uniref:LOW QUALITY PROTEIN: lysosomal cobalamin transporter ABCD4-like n=1 Tax=Pollicipes pollicipes TaxID=41117 RepID=UPI001884DCC7|nr:LOW QUALITY PROTEIN: lysosomal cobalamin transporter ABCD4-like [Pollicipes pollicipes]